NAWTRRPSGRATSVLGPGSCWPACAQTTSPRFARSSTSTGDTRTSWETSAPSAARSSECPPIGDPDGPSVRACRAKTASDQAISTFAAARVTLSEPPGSGPEPRGEGLGLGADLDEVSAGPRFDWECPSSYTGEVAPSRG